MAELPLPVEGVPSVLNGIGSSGKSTPAAPSDLVMPILLKGVSVILVSVSFCEDPATFVVEIGSQRRVRPDPYGSNTDRIGP